MSEITFGTVGSIYRDERNYIQRWKAKNCVKLKKAFYNVLFNTEALYLPEKKARCITQDYLEGVLLKRYFSIPVYKVRKCSIKNLNVTSELLFFEIISWFVENNIEYNLGFD